MPHISEIWNEKAEKNMDKWGIQDPVVILLAIQEELGELTQAYLEATYENGEKERVREEMHDLGALLYQLHYSLNESPRAYLKTEEL